MWAFKATSSQCVQDVKGLLILGSRECIAWPRPLEVGTARYRQRPNFGLLHSRRRRRSLVVLEQYTALPNQYAYERRRQVRRRFVSTGTHRAKGRSFSATEKDEGGLSVGLAAGLSTFGKWTSVVLLQKAILMLLVEKTAARTPALAYSKSCLMY